MKKSTYTKNLSVLVTSLQTAQFAVMNLVVGVEIKTKNLGQKLIRDVLNSDESSSETNRFEIKMAERTL